MLSARCQWFPLTLKEELARYTEGLSTNETEKLKDLPNIYANPIHIPDREPHYKITVVWDLDQTLVSSDGLIEKDIDKEDPDRKLIIRPRAHEILKILKRNEDVEFIIWTAGNKAHMMKVVYSLDGIKFDHIIYRHRCWYNDDNPVKDLRTISNESRPLSSMVLIDDRMDVGQHHPENLLIVPKFEPYKSHGDNDMTLLFLANVLQKAIYMYRSDDSKPLNNYFYGPLVEKCVRDERYYYGIKCFKNKDELRERIKKFE